MFTTNIKSFLYYVGPEFCKEIVRPHSDMAEDHTDYVYDASCTTCLHILDTKLGLQKAFFSVGIGRTVLFIPIIHGLIFSTILNMRQFLMTILAIV